MTDLKKNLLKELRGDKKQIDIANEYNVSQQCWQSWEAGRTLPPNSVMLKMEKDFNTPMEVIFFDSFNYKIK